MRQAHNMSLNCIISNILDNVEIGMSSQQLKLRNKDMRLILQLLTWNIRTMLRVGKMQKKFRITKWIFN